MITLQFFQRRFAGIIRIPTQLYHIVIVKSYIQFIVFAFHFRNIKRVSQYAFVFRGSFFRNFSDCLSQQHIDYGRCIITSLLGRNEPGFGNSRHNQHRRYLNFLPVSRFFTHIDIHTCHRTVYTHVDCLCRPFRRIHSCLFSIHGQAVVFSVFHHIGLSCQVIRHLILHVHQVIGMVYRLQYSTGIRINRFVYNGI